MQLFHLAPRLSEARGRGAQRPRPSADEGTRLPSCVLISSSRGFGALAPLRHLIFDAPHWRAIRGDDPIIHAITDLLEDVDLLLFIGKVLPSQTSIASDDEAEIYLLGGSS